MAWGAALLKRSLVESTQPMSPWACPGVLQLWDSSRTRMVIAQPRVKEHGGPNHSPPTQKRTLERWGRSLQVCTLSWQEATITSCSTEILSWSMKKKMLWEQLNVGIGCLENCWNTLWEITKTWLDGAPNNLIPTFNGKLYHVVSRVSFQWRLSSDFMIFCFNYGAFIQGWRRVKTGLGVN